MYSLEYYKNSYIYYVDNLVFDEARRDQYDYFMIIKKERLGLRDSAICDRTIYLDYMGSLEYSTLDSYISYRRSYMRLSEYSYIVQETAIDDEDYNLRRRQISIMARNYINNGRSFLNGVVQRCEDKAIVYCKDNLKKYFGKEYSIGSRDQYTIGNVTTDFIRKYDKKFKDHSVQVSSNTYRIIDTSFILKLEEATYAYIATGIKIGSLEEKFFMKQNIDGTDLYMYIFGRKMRKYCKEIDTIINKSMIDDDLGIYNIDTENTKEESLDVVYSKMNRRDLCTLFYSNNEKESICNHIDRFLANEDFYKNRQILYKTGILLYGKPGTGKSSLIKAIATKYNRSIVNINVSKIKSIDLNLLTQAINVDDNKKYIILMEDIDTLFLNRDKEIDKEDASVVNKLLQFLDSNTSPNNVIFIATTNHIDRLDSALLREGRFDIKVEIGELKRPEAMEFCYSFSIASPVAEEILSNIEAETGDAVFNQSKLQTRCLAKIENRSLEEAMKLHEEEVN